MSTVRYSFVIAIAVGASACFVDTLEPDEETDERSAAVQCLSSSGTGAAGSSGNGGSSCAQSTGSAGSQAGGAASGGAGGGSGAIAAALSQFFASSSRTVSLPAGSLGQNGIAATNLALPSVPDVVLRVELESPSLAARLGGAGGTGGGGGAPAVSITFAPSALGTLYGLSAEGSEISIPVANATVHMTAADGMTICGNRQLAGQAQISFADGTVEAGDVGFGLQPINAPAPGTCKFWANDAWCTTDYQCIYKLRAGFPFFQYETAYTGWCTPGWIMCSCG